MRSTQSDNDHSKENMPLSDERLAEFLNATTSLLEAGGPSNSKSNANITKIAAIGFTQFMNELHQYTTANGNLGLKTTPLVLILRSQFLSKVRYGEISDESVGSGQQGEVFTMRTDSGGTDAVKVIPVHFESIEELIAHSNEFEKLLYFQHKNVVPIIDAWSMMSDDIDGMPEIPQINPEQLVDLKRQCRFHRVKLFLQMPFRPMTLEMWIEKFKEFEGKCEKNRSMWDRIKHFFGFGPSSVDDFVQFRLAISTHCKQHFETYNFDASDPESNDKKSKSIDNIMHGWDHNDMIFNVFYQLLKGFQFLHTNGIMHGDVHPRNIFIGYGENGDLHVELGDFGLACEFSLRRTGKFSTNPYYASPEQLRGERFTENDLYSLAVILLDIVVLKKPSSIDEWKAKRKEIIEMVKGGGKPENVPQLYLNLLQTLCRGDSIPSKYLSGTIPEEYLLKWSSCDEGNSSVLVSENARIIAREKLEALAEEVQSELDRRNAVHQEFLAYIQKKLEESGVDFDEFRKGYF